jgi:hypothetical protein
MAPKVKADRRQRAEEPAVRLTWRQVMAWRPRRHHLDRRAPPEAMLDVVAELGGLHAQLMSSAELTLWARVEALEQDAVRRALWDERSLVKTWAMRGTLHLLPSAEYPLWQAALSKYRHYLKPSWLRYFGVTGDELERLLAAVAEALDGRTLTREELSVRVGELTGSAELGEKLRESWGAMLKPAAFRGQLCFAPSRGQNVRFTRPDRWLRDGSPVKPDDALVEITRRFLAANGPATREDYARWWAMTPARAMKLIAGLGEEVAQVEVEGTRAWMLAEHAQQAASAARARSVRLLPAFDQYVVAASRHARNLLPGPFEDRVYRPQGWLSPVLLVDGRMDGIWRHERRGRRIEVRLEPFVEVPAWARSAAEDEADRLARFLGGSLELSWSA